MIDYVNLFIKKPERLVRERGQSASPPTLSNSQQQQQANLASFSPINRMNQNVQQQQSVLELKRSPASTSQTSASALNLSYPSNISTTYSNVLSPIFSHLASKYRHSTTNTSLSSSNNSNNTIDHSIDELKTAFFHLEQQNPGACDLFVKYLFQYLKPSN